MNTCLFHYFKSEQVLTKERTLVHKVNILYKGIIE